jgi:uncharacterized damage-inducible protein DinB
MLPSASALRNRAERGAPPPSVILPILLHIVLHVHIYIHVCEKLSAAARVWQRQPPTMTAQDAIRAALDSHGKNVKPREIVNAQGMLQILHSDM